MVTKPIRAFGWVVLYRYWEAGTKYVELVTEDIPCITYCVKGRSISVRREDANGPMQRVVDFAEGIFYAMGSYIPGVFDMEVVEDNETYCFDSRLNGGFKPNISRIEVDAGVTVDIPQNSKWFLCRGVAVIDGKTVEGPTQIYAKNAGKTLSATEKCFIMIFP